jgi:hypothetical protein
MKQFINYWGQEDEPDEDVEESPEHPFDFGDHD